MSTKELLEVDPYRKAVTIPRAAKIFEKSRYFVYDLINAGKLETVKIGGATYITIKSIMAIQTPK